MRERTNEFWVLLLDGRELPKSLIDTGEPKRQAGLGLNLTVTLEGRVAYAKVRSAGSVKSGNKRTDGPNQIENPTEH